MTGRIEHSTTHSFKAKSKSRELQWQEELLLLWSVEKLVHPWRLVSVAKIVLNPQKNDKTDSCLNVKFVFYHLLLST